jgi:uncharacterized protein YigE (DUF2233 family)
MVLPKLHWHLQGHQTTTMPSTSTPRCYSIRFGSLEAIICSIDLREHTLRLFYSDAEGRPLKSFRSLELLLHEQQQALVLGMNAGMFHSDYTPVGLLVIEGRELQPLNLQSGAGNFFLQPNGVLVLSDGEAGIIESQRYPALASKARFATQSGPLLVSDGVIHPDINADGTSTYIRNGVGLIDEHRVVLAITEEPVSLHEFATLFRDHLNCSNALYLDGSISSLFAADLQRCDALHSFGPMLAVTTR